MNYLYLFHFSLRCGILENPFCWIATGVIIFNVCLCVSVILGVTFSKKPANTADDDLYEAYALTDKILLSYNTAFCQSLTATYTDDQSISKSNATLYMLSSQPPLSDEEDFKLEEKINNVVHYVLSYYLNKGSNVLVVARITYDYGDSVSFFLLKGINNFKRWKDDDFPDGEPGYYEESRTIYSASDPIKLSYDVTETDRYYFVFHNYLDYDGANVRALFQFQRTVYHISPDLVISHCSFPLSGQSKHCSTGVPLSAGNAAILSLNTSLPVDDMYNKTASISISCQRRAWLIAIIVMVATVIAVSMTILVIFFVYKYIKKRMNEYSLVAGGIVSRDTFTRSKVTVANTKPTESSPLLQST